MKKILFIAALFGTAFTQNAFSQDTTTQSRIPQLLSLYYNIKDALVAGNTNVASSKAQAFVQVANSIDHKIFPEGNINALLKDAGKISDTKDINKQREYFINFSTNMALAAKAVKLSDQPIYQAYCPMKKAYWLSSEKAIKNPYYGSAMLTCGQVTETL